MTSRRLAAGILAIGLLLGLRAPAVAQDWKAARALVAGTDADVWVVGVSREADDGLPVMQIWHGGPDGAAAPRQPPFLKDIAGDPQAVGADAEALRVLFSDLSTYNYFSDRRPLRGRPWRDVSTESPLAWAGAAAREASWALARPDALLPAALAPTTRPARRRERAAATQPDTAPAVLPTWAAEAGLVLLKRDRGQWRLAMAGPTAATRGTAFWLAVRNRDIGLFWQEAGGRVRFARHDGEAWTSPENVVAGGISAAWAGAAETGPALLAVHDHGVLKVHLRKDHGWAAETAREGTEPLTLEPGSGAAAIARGRLAVVRVASDGAVELGEAELGVSPAVRFERLSLRGPSPTMEPSWRDTLVLIVAVGILTMVLFSRREQVLTVRPLPPGLVLAPVWKRVIGAGLDYLPPFLIVLPWWLPLLNEMQRETATPFWNATEIRADLLARMQALSMATTAVYGAWCFLWEWGMKTTPGKLLLGCRVITEAGEPINVRQAFIRNLVRMFVFGIGAPGLIISLMTMALMSRNRQRIGDLLAHTIVVEAAPAEPPAQEGDTWR